MFLEETKKKLIELSKIKKYRIKINEDENITHNKCGDEIKFKINENNGKINIQYDTAGCIILFASAYLLVKILNNKTKSEIVELTNKIINKYFMSLKEIDAELEIFDNFLETNRFDCFLLPYKALKETLIK